MVVVELDEYGATFRRTTLRGSERDVIVVSSEDDDVLIRIDEQTGRSTHRELARSMVALAKVLLGED